MGVAGWPAVGKNDPATLTLSGVALVPCATRTRVITHACSQYFLLVTPNKVQYLRWVEEQAGVALATAATPLIDQRRATGTGRA